MAILYHTIEEQKHQMITWNKAIYIYFGTATTQERDGWLDAAKSGVSTSVPWAASRLMGIVIEPQAWSDRYTETKAASQSTTVHMASHPSLLAHSPALLTWQTRNQFNNSCAILWTAFWRFGASIASNSLSTSNNRSTTTPPPPNVAPIHPIFEFTG